MVVVVAMMMMTTMIMVVVVLVQCLSCGDRPSVGVEDFIFSLLMLKLRDPCPVRLARPVGKGCTPRHIDSKLIYTGVAYASRDEIHCV